MATKFPTLSDLEFYQSKQKLPAWTGKIIRPQSGVIASIDRRSGFTCELIDYVVNSHAGDRPSSGELAASNLLSIVRSYRRRGLDLKRELQNRGESGVRHQSEKARFVRAEMGISAQGAPMNTLPLGIMPPCSKCSGSGICVSHDQEYTCRECLGHRVSFETKRDRARAVLLELERKSADWVQRYIEWQSLECFPEARYALSCYRVVRRQVLMARIWLWITRE